MNIEGNTDSSADTESAEEYKGPTPEEFSATRATLHALFQDMVEHQRSNPHANIVSADNPQKRCVGYLCRTTGCEWYITLSQIRTFPRSLREYMQTPKGRRELAKLLTRGVNPLDTPEV